MTTAALTVPIVLLRRQRSRALANPLPLRRPQDLSTLASRFTPISNPAPSNEWPPKPRRTVFNTSTGSPSAPRIGPRPTNIYPGSGSASSLLVRAKDLQLDEKTVLPDDDGFNAPLYTAKAFGIATLIVAVCATTAVWGVKTSMGVKDVRPLISISFHVCLIYI